MSCHFLLQSIFPPRGSNLHLLYWQAGSLPLSHQGSPLRTSGLISYLFTVKAKWTSQVTRTLAFPLWSFWPHLCPVLFTKHFSLFWFMCFKASSLLKWSYPRDHRYIMSIKRSSVLSNSLHPRDYTVYEILQARILEWVVFPFSRGSSQPRDRTQGSNPGLSHCRWILYQLSHKGSSRILEWVAYPFSSGSSWPRNWTGVSCIAGGFLTNWAIREAPKINMHV